MKQFNIIIISLLLVLVSCGSKTNKKTEITESLKIVSLVPSITKNLVYLGMEESIVGATSYCNITADKPELIVGTAIDVNEEKVMALSPNIVFYSTLTKPATVDMLKKLGIKTHLIGKTHSFDEICAQFMEIGRIVKKEEKATVIIAEKKRVVDSLKALVPVMANKPKVFFQIGAKPLFSVLPNTFMDDYITFAGGVNMASDMTKGTITRESVLLRNPDVIIVVTMGMVGEEEKENWKNYKELNAVKKNQIFIVESDVACTPTPVSFTKTLERIISDLYGND